MKREILHIQQDEIEDFTNKNCSWKINGETYKFIDTYLSERGDGECHEVIVQRKSDKKYFNFRWCYYHDSYYYEPQWDEVTRKAVIKVIYEWND
jgi:hypothetical protein